MALRRQLVTLCAAFLVGMSSSPHAQPKPPESPPDLVSLCASTDPDQVAYCDGYIDGASHFWKAWAACNSMMPGDKAYCAGSKAATQKVEQALKSCKDCYTSSFPGNSREMWAERMRAFRDELKATLGVCSPNWERRNEYCAGYNEEVANILAYLATDYGVAASKDAQEQGRRDGAAAAHQLDEFGVWGGDFEYYAFRPCLKPSTATQEMRQALLEFARDDPEQLRARSPILALEKALYYRICPGTETGAVPHMEHCTDWGYEGGQYGTKNTCDKPVVIEFMAEGREAIKREVAPGGSFRTGLGASDSIGGWKMFTVCPVGYRSSVPFVARNHEAIESSLYSCVRE